MAYYIVETQLSCGTNRDSYPSETEARKEYDDYCQALLRRGYKLVAENRDHNARMYSNAVKGDYRKVLMYAA